MAKMNHILLIGLVLILVTQCCAAYEYKIYQDYLLQFGYINPFHFGEIYRGIRDLLLSLEIDETTKMSDIREQLETLKSKDGSDRLKRIHQCLYSCSSGTFNDWRGLIESAMWISNERERKRDIDIASRARNFLEIFFKPIIKEIIESEKFAKRRELLYSMYLKQFDQVFGPALEVNLMDPDWDETLSKKLKTFSPRLDELNVRQLIAAAERSRIATLFDVKELESFYKFMDQNCQSGSLDDLLALLNLNAYLDGKKDLGNVDDNRMNDYNRFCKQWLMPTPKMFIKSHLEDELKRPLLPLQRYIHDGSLLR